MYPVTDRFLRALTLPHTIKTTATYQTPGGVETPLDIRRDSASAVALDVTSRVRRRATLQVNADGATYADLTTPGCIFRVWHGLDYGSSDEMVPVFTGELQQGERPRGSRSGAVTLPLLDMWARLVACPFIEPFVVILQTTRAAGIAAAVAEAMPTVTIVDTSTRGGALTVTKVWTDSRVGAIVDLATDGNLDVYFNGAGEFVIADKPLSSTQAVWHVSAITEFVDTRPLDKLVNMVVVRPSAVDGSQTWPQQVAYVTDSNHPRHASKIGPRPYVWASPTAATAAEAMEAAQAILYRLLGSTDTAAFGSLSNPALEGFDVIRITAPAVGREPAQTYSHFVDGYVLNLSTGHITVSTRKQAP